MHTKFLNKSINHIVETDFIHTNSETRHIYLIKRHNTPIKNKKLKKMYTNKSISTNNSIYIFYFMYTIIIIIFSLVAPIRGLPKPKGLWGLPHADCASNLAFHISIKPPNLPNVGKQ